MKQTKFMALCLIIGLFLTNCTKEGSYEALRDDNISVNSDENKPSGNSLHLQGINQPWCTTMLISYNGNVAWKAIATGGRNGNVHFHAETVEGWDVSANTYGYFASGILDVDIPVTTPMLNKKEMDATMPVYFSYVGGHTTLNFESMLTLHITVYNRSNVSASVKSFIIGCPGQ